MAPTSEDHPVIPDTIRVERDPGGVISVLIDGERLPWAVAADTANPVTVDTIANTAPGVRLTLIAKSVEVADRLLAETSIPGHEST